jgi:hypothetical protein
MLDKIKAEVKYARFEYDGWFSRPVFEPSRLYAAVGGVYQGLEPYNVTASDVKYPGGATSPIDTLLRIQLAKQHYELNLTLAGFKFKAEYVDWTQEPIITNIIEATTQSLTSSLNTKVTAHQLQIQMHVLLPGVSMKEFTRKLLPSVKRPDSDAEFHGLILHTATGTFLCDKSAAFDNAMFVSIVRKFAGQPSFKDMAKDLMAEEMWLADTLGIEIE